MKIVMACNFDNEWVADSLVADNVNSDIGEELTEFLNEKYSGDYHPRFYKLVDDDYKLYEVDY